MSDSYLPVSHSQTELSELMVPAHANFGGKVHGGLLLSMMDKVAYACAAKHSGCYCVTVSVDGVEFLKPVEVGDMVHLLASVNYVGRSSMLVGIRVETEKLYSKKRMHTNTCYFTMVAKDEDGNPTQVPGLILQNGDQKRRYYEAVKRKGLRKRFKEELENNRTAEEAKDYDFSNERCRIELA